MKYAVITDIGKRSHNEDSYLLPPEGCELCLFAVADGMGGHAAGAVASKLLVDGLSGNMLSFGEGHEVEELKNAIERVNLSVYETAEEDVSLRGMGSTLVCALILGDKYIVANVGDSRLYHFDGETISRITTDHSLVEQLVMIGSITKKQARIHPQRNIITRAMGISPVVDVDLFECDWEPGDVLLLCSDGLHGSVEDEDIAEALQSDLNLETKCELLVRRALNNGGTDNITIILVQNDEEDAV
ncbi:MAG: Stp1/IreP family PP2C-type Ser/Thr phosphatase [Clostridiaceae bacterium]